MKKVYLILVIFILSVVPTNQIQGHSVKAMESREELAQKLNDLLLKDPDLKGAVAGVSIRSAANGELIYDHFGETRMRPASNMKLLTAAAALSVLGENYKLKTEILTDGKVKRKTLNGNLFIKGKGDPTLLKSKFNKMAQELKKMGIRKINGDLIGDDSWYDDIRYSVDLPWSDEERYYGAQISALTASPNNDFDAGTVILEVKPGKEMGEKAIVKIIPNTDYMKVVNHSTTVSPKGKKKITIEREHAKNIITINGTLPVNQKKTREWIAVWEPTLFVLDLFKQSLEDQGIRLIGKAKKGIAPKTAQILHSNSSIPLSELVIPFMKLSNNGHAELLIKEMGKVEKGEGSWENGLKVLKRELTKFGVNPETMVLRDGSGISHVDLIPPNQISYLLYSVQKEKWFPSYLNSLPISGSREKLIGGTLRKRLKDPTVQGKVRAKTGTISTVSSLSGYIKTNSGETLIFSILLNNLLNDTKGKKIEDKLVMILVNQ